MIKPRYLQQFVKKDLKEKMVFIGGPRQVGKTTFAEYIGKKDYQEFSYMNWDYREDRKKIIEGEFEGKSKLVIFDEIHKYKQWKNLLKGEYDKYKNKFDILVTGSARLDIYRKGGDSLMGRYHYYRLHPFSVSEMVELLPQTEPFKELSFKTDKQTKNLFSQLFKFGGFPEPLLKQEELTLRRWHNERVDRFIIEDVRDTANIRDISAIQLLVEILPEKVGALLSINSLTEDLKATFKTISSWVDILEKLYYHFRIYPFASSKIKSLRKVSKLYLWDWSEIMEEGRKLENITASHLLKYCHFLHDAKGYKAELSYIRDKDQREVDFLVTIDKKPWFAVEVKQSDTNPSSHLNYFGNKLKIPFRYQLVNKFDIDILKDNIRIISIDKFLTGLI